MDSPEPFHSTSKQRTTFHKIPDTVIDTVRRIASHENVAKLATGSRSQSHVSLNSTKEYPSVRLAEEDFEDNSTMSSSKIVVPDSVVHLKRKKNNHVEGQENPAFINEQDEAETDRVAPLRRMPDLGEHKKEKPSTSCATGTENLETLPKPLEGIIGRIRRISSKQSIHSYFHRNTSNTSFRDSDEVKTDKFQSGENSFIDMQEFGGLSIEDVEQEITERVEQLHRGVSNPVFHIHTDDEDDDCVQPSRKGRHSSSQSLHVAAERSNRKLSFGYASLETLPNVVNYGQMSDLKTRPTLDDLRREKEIKENELVRNTGNEASFTSGKLGWIQGVVLWTLQDMWAVQLFLRLPWMNAQAGIGLYTLIVLLSTAIALLTTLSTSAIATNGEIGIGGTYFMIARSLGPHYGAGIGVIFALANVINCALNVQGFADLISSLMENYSIVMVNHLDDTRIISVIALVGITGIALLGMVIASRLKLLCLLLLVAGLLNTIIGSLIPPTEEQQAQGFVGYSPALFAENFKPAFQEDKFGSQDFLTIFAIFFPSITGILAGTSITGDLKNPSSSIPKGTIVGTFLAAFVYLVFGWVSAAVNLRHASGNVEDLRSGNLTACSASRSCHYGLINDMEILEITCHFRPIFIAATIAATVSTALGNIHFAPKVFQALCRDKIFPYIGFFGKGYGRHDEPYRAYFLVMVIAIAFLMPSDFNFISNIVSNCFLLTFALINYATFDASFSKSPGWRPNFKYYNMWLSLATAVACLGLMFALDWKSAIIVFGFIFIIWLYVFYKKPDVSWGTSIEANVYQSALTDVLKLQKVQDHVKNFRPQILVLTGLPVVRPGLVYLANSITGGAGLLICGHVMVGEQIMERRILEQEIYKWFWKRKIRAFYEYFASNNTSEGIRALIQTSGLGKLRPNILMMGYHTHWSTMNAASLDEYVGVIHDAFDSQHGLIIAYTRQGFDMTSITNFEQIVRENALVDTSTSSIGDLDTPETEVPLPLECSETANPKMKARVALAEWLEPGKKKKIRGEIHVWWLYDDGGLTILVPYLMTLRSPWNGCKIKVFCLADKDGNLEEAKISMTVLLNKFRIKVADIMPVDLDQPPSKSSTDAFNKVISQYGSNGNRLHDAATPIAITDEDWSEFSTRTKKQIRLSELLKQYSSDAVLNVVTLPMPQRSTCSTLYMAILDTMTSGMPTTLLIRGNQENVLTYHC